MLRMNINAKEVLVLKGLNKVEDMAWAYFN
jgi:hypothetical protein